MELFQVWNWIGDSSRAILLCSPARIFVRFYYSKQAATSRHKMNRMWRKNHLNFQVNCCNWALHRHSPESISTNMEHFTITTYNIICQIADSINKCSFDYTIWTVCYHYPNLAQHSFQHWSAHYTWVYDSIALFHNIFFFGFAFVRNAEAQQFQWYISSNETDFSFVLVCVVWSMNYEARTSSQYCEAQPSRSR